MGLNKYSLKVIIRLILIFANFWVIIYFIPKPNKVITALFFVFMAIAQIILLIRFVNSVNRDLARFLIELKENDTSEVYFPDNLEKNFKNFKYSFQQISNEIKKSRLDETRQKQFLNYVIENIKDGLISFDDDGGIKLLNPSAKNLLGIKYLRSIWDLDKVHNGLAKKLLFAAPGSQELIKIKNDSVNSEFLFNISEVRIDRTNLKIVTFQDLKKELEVKELNAWKKLMRVLTHEIMNSLTPITTLSTAVRRILQKDQPEDTVDIIDKDELLDIYKNNEAIEKRSNSLMDFVNQFRQLWKIPELSIEEIKLKTFFDQIKLLFSEDFKQKQIDFKIKVVPPDLICKFDKKLMDQVLINLIRNSVDALENIHHKRIHLSAHALGEYVIIEVYDNGKGIEKEIADEVFVPFFTTKKQGSGIGLSLSKEIIQKHEGELYFNSDITGNTFFYIKLNKKAVIQT